MHSRLSAAWERSRSRGIVDVLMAWLKRPASDEDGCGSRVNVLSKAEMHDMCREACRSWYEENLSNRGRWSPAEVVKCDTTLRQCLW